MHKKGIGFVVLGVVGVFTIFGVLASSNRVFATQTCTTDNETGIVTCNDSITASVIVKTSCGFTITGDGNYTLTLANNSTNNVNGSQFTTTCNSPNGYALYAVGFSGNQVGNTKLLAQTIGSTYDIQTGSGSSNWKMNLTSTGSYGTVVPAYDAGTGTTKNYADIPASYTKVAYYTPASGDASTQSVFQTNYQATVSSTQPADNYVGQVKYTLIPTNESLSKTIFELEYMQDFASLSATQKTDVLKSMITDEQYTLTDNRDGKEYYIAKLRDGNVWMTQNLDHDIVTTTDFYTPANTDIPANWTASTATSATWSGSTTTPESYDPGNYCWSGVLDDDNLADCGTSLGEPNHYHLGNYYNWTAAVAMNDSSGYDTEEGIVDQSICPAGWTLPIIEPESTSGSYSGLLANYGLTTYWSLGEIEYEMYDPFIWDDSLYFPLSGSFFLHYGDFIMGDIGNGSWFWSSSLSNYHGVFGNKLHLAAYQGGEIELPRDGGDDDYSHSDGKNGNSVRCVAR